MKIKISLEELRKYLEIEPVEFPKYTAPIINLANQYAQGTRPKIVGQMSELIQEFTGRTLEEWEQWYLEQKPDAIRVATEKIIEMLQNFKDTLNSIDKGLVEQWVRDLVVVKTFIGLRFQEAILKKGAEIKATSYRLAGPEEESKGIDGYIGDLPVSIKPHTYDVKTTLSERIGAKIIYYRKLKDGLEVDFGEVMEGI
ncbi:MAG: MjaI family restriction endonuclease [bacterium]